MRRNRLAAYIIALVLLISCCSSVTFAQDGGIRLYVDNVEQSLKNPCLVEDGIVYVPLEETFFKMGIYMSWNEREGCWFGEGNNGEIRLTPGAIKADIDWVDVEMPGPVKEINGVAMMPAYIIEDAAKVAPPVYDEETQSLYVEFPDITYKPEKEFQVESVVPYLPEGVDLFKEEQLFDLQPDTGAENIVYTTVDVEGMPFDKAIQLETLPMNPTPLTDYSVQMDTVITGGDFKAGDVGLMTYWARAVKITDESGLAKFRATYEQLHTWQKACMETVNISYEWKKYYLPMWSGSYSLYSGNSHVTFVCGYKPQIIQIADMHLYNFGDQVDRLTLFPDAESEYKGIEEDALWRKEAYKRIEKYRKNDMLVHVTDENGNPIEGVTVKADLKDHEFMLGNAICYNELCELDMNSKIGQIKSEVVDKTLNTGVCGLEMKSYQLLDDYRQGAKMINEYLRRGKRTRGHALAWDELTLDLDHRTEYTGLPEDRYEEMYDIMIEDALGKAWMFKGTITEWDGLNEPHDSNDWRNKFGTEVFSEIFQNTKAIDPKSKLIVNETGMEGHANREESMRGPALRRIVDTMVDEERAPIDGLGVQGHCTRYLYPQGFYRELDVLVGDRYDTVSVTEYDFYNTDYTWAPQHLRDTFIATFSHPKAAAFVIWGYQDYMHWRGYGPFYDRQWNKKREYDEWLRLITEEFTTHETATTDADGNAKIRGYRGKYEITVEADGVSDKIEFTLTNAEDAARDNKVNVVLKDGKLQMSTSNPWEVYAENNSSGRVEFDTFTAALADYNEKTAGKELIGVYKHTDQDGNTLPRANDGLYNSFHYFKDGGYAQYELVKKADKGTVSVDFRAPQGEVYKYKVLGSADGEEYTELYAGTSAEKVEIPYENTMFIRIVNDGNEYMGISEVNINAEKKKN